MNNQMRTLFCVTAERRTFPDDGVKTFMWASFESEEQMIRQTIEISAAFFDVPNLIWRMTKKAPFGNWKEVAIIRAQGA